MIHRRLRRRARPEVEVVVANLATIGILFIAFGLMNAYLILPESEVLYDPFVLSFPDRETGELKRQYISAQSYIDYLATRVGMVLIYYAFFRAVRKKMLWIILWMQVGYVIDYVLIYNQPYFFVDLGPFKFPVMYATLMVVPFTYLFRYVK